MKPAGVCPGPSSNPTRRKTGCGPELGELPEIWGFPFIISATAEASDFKYGANLGFVKSHHKITHRKEGERGAGPGKHPKIWGFPFNI